MFPGRGRGSAAICSERAVAEETEQPAEETPASVGRTCYMSTNLGPVPGLVLAPHQPHFLEGPALHYAAQQCPLQPSLVSLAGSSALRRAATVPQQLVVEVNTLPLWAIGTTAPPHSAPSRRLQTLLEEQLASVRAEALSN